MQISLAWPTRIGKAKAQYVCSKWAVGWAQDEVGFVLEGGAKRRSIVGGGLTQAGPR